MNLKPLSLLTTSFLLSSSLCGEEVKLNLQEVASFALQKYRVDFNAQTDKSKQDIINEYAQATKINSVIAPILKDDLDFKVATTLLGVEMWAQKFMMSINPSDDELKKIYVAQAPKVSARYNLRNILVKEDSEGSKLLKTLNSIKDNAKKLSKFKELVKSESIDLSTKNKEGEIGYIDVNKLDKSVQDALKDKNSGDIVKVTLPNIGTQLLYVEEYQTQRVATFEESKQLLVNLLRQEELKQAMRKLLESKK